MRILNIDQALNATIRKLQVDLADLSFAALAEGIKRFTPSIQELLLFRFIKTKHDPALQQLDAQINNLKIKHAASHI